MFIIKVSARQASKNMAVPTSYMTTAFEPQELEIIITRVDDQSFRAGAVALTNSDYEFMEKVRRIVAQHLGKSEFNVVDLSTKMAMSPSSFYRRLKSITGQTSVEFVRNARLNLAANMLAVNGLCVSEVAYEVGFSDMKYFRKAFQKRFGQAPSAYARQHRNNSAADAPKQDQVK